MKICVVGAGAIGGVLAFQLCQSGHDVSVVVRGQNLEAIRQRGLTLVNYLEGASMRSLPLPASDDPAALAASRGVQDVIILGLKAHAIASMLPRIQSLVGAHTSVVAAINGVPWWYFYREGGAHSGAVVHALDPGATMFCDLDPAHILGCVVHAAAEVRAPGVVHYTGGKRFILGEIDRTLADPFTPRLSVLAAAMTGAGFEASTSGDIRTDVWAKLIGNLSFNPVAALTNSLMDRICASQELLAIIRPLLIEGMQVARAYGIEMKMTPDERIDLARQLGNAKISMHQDFEGRRVPEIDAIVGAVIELAQWANVRVPTIEMIDALVRARAVNLGLLPHVG